MTEEIDEAPLKKKECSNCGKDLPPIVDKGIQLGWESCDCSIGATLFPCCKRRSDGPHDAACVTWIEELREADREPEVDIAALVEAHKRTKAQFLEFKKTAIHDTERLKQAVAREIRESTALGIEVRNLRSKKKVDLTSELLKEWRKADGEERNVIEGRLKMLCDEIAARFFPDESDES